LLATGNVVINGTIDVSGQDGGTSGDFTPWAGRPGAATADAAVRRRASRGRWLGPGGGHGGIDDGAKTIGGGGGGYQSAGANAQSWTTVFREAAAHVRHGVGAAAAGGSGGGGGAGSSSTGGIGGGGGGGGGGAVLIASSGTISGGGLVLAQGGNGARGGSNARARAAMERAAAVRWSRSGCSPRPLLFRSQRAS
jgi:hypothetical protein